MKEINLLELFSGTGGFTKGFLDAGYTIKNHYFSEIDKHAIANYKYNFKNAEYYGSVTDVRGKRGEADIITFGSPCQDFSLAGKRAGMEGQRSSLILEAIRLIGEIRPSIFIWENVKGTFSSNNGADFWAILASFANIGGYRLEWQLLNTSWFLPQNRQRIYLIGHLDGRSEPGVFPIGEEYKHTNDKKWRKSKYASTITNSSGKIGYDMNVVQVKLNTSKGYEELKLGDSLNFSVPTSKTRRGRVCKGQAQTLDTQCNQGVIGYSRDSKGKIINYHEKEIANTLHSSSGSGGNTDQYVYKNKAKDISQTLDTQCNQGVIAGAIRGRGEENKQELELRKDGKTNSITSVQKDNVIANDMQIRRLTEIECERLQGFPDNWTKYGIYDGEVKEVPKTQRYKMMGNAVTVKVVEKIAKKLKINKQ